MTDDVDIDVHDWWRRYDVHNSQRRYITCLNYDVNMTSMTHDVDIWRPWHTTSILWRSWLMTSICPWLTMSIWRPWLTTSILWRPWLMTSICPWLTTSIYDVHDSWRRCTCPLEVSTLAVGSSFPITSQPNPGFLPCSIIYQSSDLSRQTWFKVEQDQQIRYAHPTLQATGRGP